MAVQTPTSTTTGAPAPADLAGRWEVRRAAFLAAKAANDAMTADEEHYDDENGQPVFGALCSALEAWEAAPPPTLQALVEVMRASLNFSGLHWAFGDADDPMSMRDMLDNGDTHQMFAARYYMHALRLAGVSSGALSTPPIGCLYPAYEADIQPDTPHDVADWREHHATVEPYPERADQLVDWMADFGLGGVRG
jgi:hypothetical protein